MYTVFFFFLFKTLKTVIGFCYTYYIGEVSSIFHHIRPFFIQTLIPINICVIKHKRNIIKLIIILIKFEIIN